MNQQLLVVFWLRVSASNSLNDFHAFQAAGFTNDAARGAAWVKKANRCLADAPAEVLSRETTACFAAQQVAHET